MLKQLLESSGLPRHPMYIEDIESFIKDLYEKRLKNIMTAIDKKAIYELKFINDKFLNNCFKYSYYLSYNIDGIISINLRYLKYYLSLLDTKKAQETFLLILLTHELLHSIIIRGSIDKVSYEYIVNKYTKKIIEEQFKIYSYTDLYNSVKRLNLKEDNKVHQFVKDVFLFPIAEKEYWING